MLINEGEAVEAVVSWIIGLPCSGVRRSSKVKKKDRQRKTKKSEYFECDDIFQNLKGRS